MLPCEALPVGQMATMYFFKQFTLSRGEIKPTKWRTSHPWTLLFGCLILWPHIGHATESTSTGNVSRLNLPELPGENVRAPGNINMDTQSIAVGDATHADTWGARLGGYRGTNFSIAAQQGWLLSDTLGAGSVYTYHSDYSEAMVNGVYAPQADLRIQFTASEMHSKTNLTAASSGRTQAVLQTSQLLDVQKKWKSGGVFSEAGIAIFSADAKPRKAKDDAGSESPGNQNASDGSAHRLATGRLNGYALNLILQPTDWSSIRMAYQRKDTSYHGTGKSSAPDIQTYGSIQYAHSFKNCSALHGRYNRATYSDEMNLHFREGNWNLGVLHTRAAGYRGTSLQVNYAVQLGGQKKAATRCAPQPNATPSFAPIVATTTARPQRLMQAPQVRLDTANTAQTSVE